MHSLISEATQKQSQGKAVVSQSKQVAKQCKKWIRGENPCWCSTKLPLRSKERLSAHKVRCFCGVTASLFARDQNMQIPLNSHVDSGLVSPVGTYIKSQTAVSVDSSVTQSHAAAVLRHCGTDSRTNKRRPQNPVKFNNYLRTFRWSAHYKNHDRDHSSISVTGSFWTLHSCSAHKSLHPPAKLWECTVNYCTPACAYSTQRRPFSFGFAVNKYGWQTTKSFGKLLSTGCIKVRAWLWQSAVM